MISGSTLISIISPEVGAMDESYDRGEEEGEEEEEEALAEREDQKDALVLPAISLCEGRISDSHT